MIAAVTIGLIACAVLGSLFYALEKLDKTIAGDE